MRLFTKIFVFGTLVFGAAFSVSGYFLLHYSMESSMTREVDFALRQYQYDKFTVQSALLTYSDVTLVLSIQEADGTIRQDFPEDKVISGEYYAWQDPWEEAGRFLWNESPELMFEELAAEIAVPAAFFSEDGHCLYSEINSLDAGFLEGLSKEAHVYQFRNSAAGCSVLVGSLLELGKGYEEKVGSSVYFVTEWDIGKTIRQQETMRQFFFRCYLAAMAAGVVLLGFLSAFLTNPLKRMSGAARRMAEGYYEERLALSGKDEMGKLAESFNQMASAVEEKMGELSRAAREKEDFVANFAHELKTPLTSIIGYADTIYQKDLPREEVRRASWHIWNKGMRLEALSLKLMELTVLGRQDFPLEEMPADELLRDVTDGLEPLFTEKEIAFRLQADRAYVMADYDLLKTLLINLVDNAIKAGSSRITLWGRQKEGEYRICVSDNGCGMEEEELSRITEAFYMVDKARSRKQHGAGLGLALSDRIAKIHNSRLVFESRKGYGTEVSFVLKCEKGGAEDEEESVEI